MNTALHWGDWLWQMVSSSWAWIAWIWLLYAMGLAGWIVLQKRSPISTLSWVTTLVLMPLLGLLIYHFFGPMRIRRQGLRRTRTEDALIAQSDINTLFAQRTQPPERLQAHSMLIERSCGMHLSTCHSAQYLQNGAVTLDALLAAIEAATQHIHLEYYIFEHDESGQAVLQALQRKAAQGVAVRLLVDAVGSPFLSGRKGRPQVATLRASGVQFGVFHPTRLERLYPLVNLRTHRKIAVIDGRIGFTGGINITDDENERVRPKSAYRDTHLRLEGAVVNWLQYVFVQDWVYATQEDLKDLPSLFSPQTPGPIHAQVIASGPDSEAHAIHRATIDAISRAKRRVWLVTPYFVPTDATRTALTNAALRGVNVRLMVPKRSDSRVVTWAARSYFDELTRVGVRIHEYGPRMLHAKTLLIDDDMACIGSANFDFRSFLLNFEVSVVLYERQANRDLAAMFEADLAHCKRVPRRRLLRMGLPQRLAESLARLLSPLL